jgi:hypothetical protein
LAKKRKKPARREEARDDEEHGHANEVDVSSLRRN